MANIVMLIGNGFDINLGLKTRYTDFERHLLDKLDREESLKTKYMDLYDYMKNDSSKYWSDAEIAFGHFPAEIKDKGHLAEIYFDSITFF